MVHNNSKIHSTFYYWQHTVNERFARDGSEEALCEDVLWQLSIRNISWKTACMECVRPCWVCYAGVCQHCCVPQWSEYSTVACRSCWWPSSTAHTSTDNSRQTPLLCVGQWCLWCITSGAKWACLPHSSGAFALLDWLVWKSSAHHVLLVWSRFQFGPSGQPFHPGWFLWRSRSGSGASCSRISPGRLGTLGYQTQYISTGRQMP